MGQRRRYRRAQERLRAQTAGMASEPSIVSDVGAIGIESMPVDEDMPILPFGAGGDTPTPPAPSLLAHVKKVSATAAGIALGAMLGGPIGLAVGGGVGAVIDWARR
jgi:hypothetical protein